MHDGGRTHNRRTLWTVPVLVRVRVWVWVHIWVTIGMSSCGTLKQQHLNNNNNNNNDNDNNSVVLGIKATPFRTSPNHVRVAKQSIQIQDAVEKPFNAYVAYVSKKKKVGESWRGVGANYPDEVSLDKSVFFENIQTRHERTKPMNVTTDHTCDLQMII